MALPNGRTSRQIAAAPNGALYITHSNVHASYVRRLAKFLRRDRGGANSLTILTLDSLVSGKFQGLSYSEVVVDHAVREVWLTERQFVCLQAARARVALKKQA